MRKECRIEKGHVMPDHVHMMIAIPPKHAVPQVADCIKNKDDPLARICCGRKRYLVGLHF